MHLPAPDLLEVLERVSAEATRGREKLAEGGAVNGATCIRRIEEMAKYAVLAAHRERDREESRS